MDIILLESRVPGNIGAAARVMNNFDFHDLVLCNPQCDHLCKEAVDRASHAFPVLEKARVVDSLSGYDVLIGTTAIIGTDYNLVRNPLTPEMLGTMELKGKVGLVIGREADGMHNSELEACDFIVAIPASKTYPTMNVSHALTVLLYELFLGTSKAKVGDNIAFASSDDKERFLRLVDKKIDSLYFPTEHKRLTQRKLWKKLVGKSFLTKRELMALYGFVKRIP